MLADTHDVLAPASAGLCWEEMEVNYNVKQICRLSNNSVHVVIMPEINSWWQPCPLVCELRSQFSDEEEDGSPTSDRQNDNDRDTTVTFEIDGECSLYL